MNWQWWRILNMLYALRPIPVPVYHGQSCPYGQEPISNYRCNNCCPGSFCTLKACIGCVPAGSNQAWLSQHCRDGMIVLTGAEVVR